MQLFASLNASPIGGSETGFFVKTLLIVVLFLYFLWLISKFLLRQSQVKGLNKAKIVEMKPIMQGKTLMVIQLEGWYYVLVSDKNNTTLIDKRSDLNYEIENHEKMSASFFHDLLNTKLKLKSHKDSE